MSNKIYLSILLFFLFFSGKLHSQYIVNTDLTIWKEKTDYIPFLSENLSAVFYYECCSYLGVLGENRYKINIRFDTVFKQDDRVYEIIGKKLCNGVITEFKGSLQIDHIELISYSFTTEISTLAAIGDFILFEENNSAVQISGVFRKYFSFNPQNEITATHTKDLEISSSEGFAGIWTDTITREIKPCYFGFYKYPSTFTGDFDAGGEPNIDVKYKEYGWEQFFKKRNGYGAYFNIEYNNVWWK